MDYTVYQSEGTSSRLCDQFSYYSVMSLWFQVAEITRQIQNNKLWRCQTNPRHAKWSSTAANVYIARKWHFTNNSSHGWHFFPITQVDNWKLFPCPTWGLLIVIFRPNTSWRYCKKKYAFIHVAFGQSGSVDILCCQWRDVVQIRKKFWWTNQHYVSLTLSLHPS